MQEVLSTKVNREKIDFCTPNALKAPFSMKQRAQNGVILTGRLVAGRGPRDRGGLGVGVGERLSGAAT